MRKIDIVVTATLRPSVLKRTLNSFYHNVFKDSGNQYKLIINIDKDGNKSHTYQRVLEVAKDFFDDVIYNSPEKPSFPQAVIWGWENTTSDYVFHLEDDWVILKRIDINEIVDLMERYPQLSTMRLPKGAIGAGGRMLKSRECPYAEEKDRKKFKLFPRISLNPSLFRGEFVRGASKIMTPDINPESQLVKGWAIKERKFPSKRIDNYLEGWEYGVYTVFGEKPLVVDIGREWRSRMNIKRKYDFTHWG